MAIDSKIEIDDAALFRQRGFSTASTQDKREAAASALALSFVNLSGTVGSLVNGAGLAMATMDLIKEFNGSAANFLDVGGSASASQVAGGLHIIASDPNVRFCPRFLVLMDLGTGHFRKYFWRHHAMRYRCFWSDISLSAT